MIFLKQAWAATWRLLAFFTIWGVLSGPFIVPIASRRGDAPVTPTLQLYFDAVSLLTMIAVAWMATRFIDRRPFQSLGFRTAGLVGDMTAGLLIAAVMTAAALAITAAAGWARIDERASGIGVPFVILAWSVAANSVAQELLFQGYVLQTIDRQFNTAIAVAGTAVLFTVAHAGVLTAGNVVPAVNLLLAGTLLALAYASTRNLWLPIALHFGWNFLQGPILGLAVSGQDIHHGAALMRTTLTGPPTISGGQFGFEGGLVGTAVTLAGIGMVLLLHGRLADMRANPATMTIGTVR